MTRKVDGRLKVVVKRQYQEFIEYIDFPTVVYIYETGKVVTYNSKARDIIGSDCKNINLLWEEKTKLKFLKEFLDNGSRIFYNKTIFVGKNKKEIDIELNAYLLDNVHVIIGFFGESYKQYFSRKMNKMFPRMFWKDKRGMFLGMNRFAHDDILCDEIMDGTMDIDIFDAESYREIRQKEEELEKGRAGSQNGIEAFPIRGRDISFVHMNRMPIINRNGTFLGSIGIYIPILKQEEYTQLFEQTLLENSILSENVSHSDTVVVCWEVKENFPIKYITSNIKKYGFNPHTILSEELNWSDIIHPDDYKKYYKFFMRTQETYDEYFISHYRIINPRGEIIWVETKTVTFLKGENTYYRQGTLRKILPEEVEFKKENISKKEQKIHVDFLRGQQYQNKGYIIVYTLNDFQYIREELGHEYGEILLKTTAEAMNRMTEFQNCCYHIEEDKFLLLIDSQYGEDIEVILKKLFELFHKPWRLSEKEFYCSISAGIATFPDDSTIAKGLLECAKEAAYEARNKGKNYYVFYKDKQKWRKQSNDYIYYEKHLREAIENDCMEFELFYQPIVRSEDKKVIAAEALLRWKNKELGFVSPMKFISLSEYLGLIVPLGEYVLKEAFRTCKQWNDEGMEDFSVSINLSVVQLIQPNIVERIAEIAYMSGIKTANIILEVTGSLALEDTELMKSVLNRLKEAGFCIALDDFGTIYSSLHHMVELPLDYVKIDKTLLEGYGTERFHPSLFSAITELAHSANMEVIVEGVETKQQMEFLTFLNIEKYQGYLFGKPESKEEFEKSYF